MVRGFLNFAGLALLIFLLPILAIPVLVWGDDENRFFLKLGFVLFGPIAFGLWYGILARRDFSYLLQIAIIVLGYVGIFFLLKLHVVTF